MTDERPPCMTPDEHAMWSRINRHLPPPDQAPSPCADCSPEYMGEQAAEGRCELRAHIERRLREVSEP